MQASDRHPSSSWSGPTEHRGSGFVSLVRGSLITARRWRWSARLGMLLWAGMLIAVPRRVRPDRGPRDQEILLALFAGDGSLEWQHVFGTTGDDQVFGVATDSAGSLYVVGSTTGAFPGEGEVGLATTSS